MADGSERTALPYAIPQARPKSGALYTQRPHTSGGRRYVSPRSQHPAAAAAKDGGLPEVAAFAGATSPRGRRPMSSSSGSQSARNASAVEDAILPGVAPSQKALLDLPDEISFNLFDQIRKSERDEREKLKAVFLAEQERIKREKLEITYSYWDGGGHRRKVEVLKGDSVGGFLKKVLEKLSKEFRELRHESPTGLMYVKEDLILPHTATFYEFIVNKVRGKSGPLFHFDVHEDVRLLGGADVEKEDTHAGKVVHRSWYEKNKHIFPASRWEQYDPLKDYGDYKVYGGEKSGGGM